ncbi:ion transporter [Alteromonas halophila]|uniref:Potassium voltage gated channel, Shab-related subfamily, member 2 n=1 Tax=Alteromonas halophila TaxID=516698 RepID=A0A918JPK5_9ALTE|nr:ion transporter [Alteromonas halophila]GGW90667.1 potassium voltage gated channel, Shab-related subfamily, member 2 [Alteromonas halophila]
MSFQRHVYHALHTPPSSPVGTGSARLVNMLLIVLIIANVVAMMLETVPALYQQWHVELAMFEVVSVAIFSIEYLLRIWVAPLIPHPKNPDEPRWERRIDYLLSPMALIDLLAILPFYLGSLVNIDLRVLRLLRVVRMIKLGRYSRSMQTIFTVIRKEARTLLAATSMLLILMVIAATIIFYLEHHAQPDVFTSIPASLWWALVTLTTVGYGDVVPVTALGKVFGGFITLLGVGLYALPAGILSSSFTAHMQQRRARFQDTVKTIIADGAISEHDAHHLERVRELLDLDEEEAELIIRLLQHHHRNHDDSQSDTSME